MRRLILLVAALLLIVSSPSIACANGMNHFVRDLLLGVFVFPLSTICIVLAFSISLSKSNRGIVLSPIVGGLISGACVPLLIQCKIFPASLVYGSVYALVGLAIGGVALLIRTTAQRRKAPGQAGKKP